MMLISVCSVKGSPGVTTFAIALAARWPQPARSVLVECDPSGGDLATRFSLASSPGLMSLAAATRRRPDPELLWQHTQVLPGGLPVVAAPPGAHQARAALEALAPEGSLELGLLRGPASTAGAVVVVDRGRIDPAGDIAADVLVLLSRAYADDLAHLATRLDATGRWARRRALILVGAGYPTSTIERELGVQVLARVPHDRRGAAALAGRPAGRDLSRSHLGRTASEVAAALAMAPTPPAAVVLGRPNNVELRQPTSERLQERPSRNGSRR